MPAEKFSLKDHLFHTKNVTRIAHEIHAVYPEFAAKSFTQTVIERFPELELMERMYWIRACLREYLPQEYEVAVKILLESLPPPLDPARSDNDFGEYIYGAYGNFVSEYGATGDHLYLSLAALREITTRFSCEFPIRTFINAFPEETLAELLVWCKDSHYHVRRLVSEGTRPKLPWAKKITLDYREPITFLDRLHVDSTRYVSRSVANHLNDISKIDPDLVIRTLLRWQKTGGQNKKELDFIVRHSLRTLIKQGHKPALAILGYVPPAISVEIDTLSKIVHEGQDFHFAFTVTSHSDSEQNILIDYNAYYQKANGSLVPKTFKITKIILPPRGQLTLTKKHSFKSMSTRKHHLGTHQLELQINGRQFGKHDFVLVH